MSNVGQPQSPARALAIGDSAVRGCLRNFRPAQQITLLRMAQEVFTRGPFHVVFLPDLVTAVTVME